MPPKEGGLFEQLFKGFLIAAFCLLIFSAISLASVSLLSGSVAVNPHTLAAAASSESPPAAAPSNAGNDTSTPKPDDAKVDAQATTKDNTTVDKDGKPTDTGCTAGNTSAACMAAGPGKLTYKPEGCNSDSCQVTCDKDTCKPEQIASAASSGGTFTPAGTNAPVSFPASTPSSQQSTPDAQLSGAIANAFTSNPTQFAQALSDQGNFSAAQAIVGAGQQTPAPTPGTIGGNLLGLAGNQNLASIYNMVPQGGGGPLSPDSQFAQNTPQQNAPTNTFGSGGTTGSNQQAQSDCQGFWCKAVQTVSSWFGGSTQTSPTQAPDTQTTTAVPPMAPSPTTPVLYTDQTNAVEGALAQTNTSAAPSQDTTSQGPLPVSSANQVASQILNQRVASAQDAFNRAQASYDNGWATLYSGGNLSLFPDAVAQAELNSAQAKLDQAQDALADFNSDGIIPPDVAAQVAQTQQPVGDVWGILNGLSSGAKNFGAGALQSISPDDPPEVQAAQAESAGLANAAAGLLDTVKSAVRPFSNPDPSTVIACAGDATNSCTAQSINSALAVGALLYAPVKAAIGGLSGMIGDAIGFGASDVASAARTLEAPALDATLGSNGTFYVEGTEPQAAAAAKPDLYTPSVSVDPIDTSQFVVRVDGNAPYSNAGQFASVNVRVYGATNDSPAFGEILTAQGSPAMQANAVDAAREILAESNLPIITKTVPGANDPGLYSGWDQIYAPSSGKDLSLYALGQDGIRDPPTYAAMANSITNGIGATNGPEPVVTMQDGQVHIDFGQTPAPATPPPVDAVPFINETNALSPAPDVLAGSGANSGAVTQSPVAGSPTALPPWASGLSATAPYDVPASTPIPPSALTQLSAQSIAPDGSKITYSFTGNIYNNSQFTINAYANGQELPVGSAQVQVYTASNGGVPFAEVDMQIDPTYQGRGYESQLVGQVNSILADNGLAGITKTAPSEDPSAYQQNGWTQISPNTDPTLYAFGSDANQNRSMVQGAIDSYSALPDPTLNTVNVANGKVSVDTAALGGQAPAPIPPATEAPSFSDVQASPAALPSAEIIPFTQESNAFWPEPNLLAADAAPLETQGNLANNALGIVGPGTPAFDQIAHDFIVQNYGPASVNNDTLYSYVEDLIQRQGENGVGPAASLYPNPSSANANGLTPAEPSLIWNNPAEPMISSVPAPNLIPLASDSGNSALVDLPPQTNTENSAQIIQFPGAKTSGAPVGPDFTASDLPNSFTFGSPAQPANPSSNLPLASIQQVAKDSEWYSYDLGGNPQSYDSFMQTGVFPNGSSVSLDQDGNVVLVRFASSEDHLVKFGEPASPEYMAESAVSFPMPGAVSTSADINGWGSAETGTVYGYNTFGVFKIPQSDFENLASQGKIIVGNLIESEFVLSGDVAKQYLVGTYTPNPFAPPVGPTQWIRIR